MATVFLLRVFFPLDMVELLTLSMLSRILTLADAQPDRDESLADEGNQTDSRSSVMTNRSCEAALPSGKTVWDGRVLLDL